MKINFGVLNIILARARQWLYVVQFFMVSAVYFKLYEFHWWHLIIILAAILFMFADQKKIYPEEIDYWWSLGKTPSDIYERIKRIDENFQGRDDD